MLRLIDAIGSDAANTILEANAGSAKINSGASMTERQLFIERKYIQREFVDQSDAFSIFAAIKNADLMQVYHSFAVSPESAFQPDTFNALHAAAIVGDMTIVAFLILNAPNPDALDDRGWSPLSYGAAYQHADVVAVLLEFGANPNAAPRAHPLRLTQAVKNEAIAAMLDAPTDAAPVQLASQLPHGEFAPREPEGAAEERARLDLAKPDAVKPERRGSGQDVPLERKEKIWTAVRRLSTKRLSNVRLPELDSP
jgi:hypothetical protein